MNKPVLSAPRTIAIFDFDGTLAEKDSLWPFLVSAVGLPRCIVAIMAGLFGYLFPCGRDRRTIIKEHLLQTLKGKRLADIEPAIKRMETWPRWMESLEALKRHHANGDHILIATGSLNLYVEEMLKNVPHDAVLCTEMEVIGGVLSGRMTLGNCVRQRKAERVADYMKRYGPFEDSWAYGNLPHDLPMMEITKHRVII